jgi:predicted RNA binding protein YcfA (HicA-like mRNA interferase family)
LQLDLNVCVQRGSLRIYGKGELRVTVPFHSGRVLHPKIVKQVVETIAEAASR